ncbi:hypothetical protein D1872_243770 [compost metagenome]
MIAVQFDGSGRKGVDVLAQVIGDLRRRQPIGGQLVGIEPDAERRFARTDFVHMVVARNRLQPGFDFIREPMVELGLAHAVFRINGKVIRRYRGVTDGGYFRGACRSRQIHFLQQAFDIQLFLLGVRFLGQVDNDGGKIVARCGLERFYALHVGDFFLQGLCHLLHYIGRRPWVLCRNEHHGDGDIGHDFGL